MAREEYALKALLLFLPFRNREHLIDEVDGTYWARFQKAKNDDELFSQGIKILQNIQDRHNAQKVKKKGDLLEQNTSCPTSDDTDKNETSVCDNHQDMEQLIPDNLLFLNSYDTVGGQNNVGTFKTVISKHNSGSKDVSSAIVSEDSLLIKQQEDKENDEQDETNINDTTDGIHLTPATVCINSMESGLNNASDEMNDMEEKNIYHIASTRTLDNKQMMAYSVICSSFMMKTLTDEDAKYDPGKVCNAVGKCITEDTQSTPEKECLEKLLKKRGAEKQLVMFLSGPAGAGKSHVIKDVKKLVKCFVTVLRFHLTKISSK